MKKHWSFRVWGFFGAVYLLSVIISIPVLLSGKGMSSPSNMILVAIYTFIPSVVGILFTYLVKDPGERRDFWRRCWRWPDASKSLLLAGLMLLPVINIGSYALSFILNSQGVPLVYAKSLFTSFPLLLQFLFVEIVFGALSEELGWRGFVLDELQSRWGALKSALVVGILWGFWHTPSFLVPGMPQYEMGGILSVPFIAFIFTAVMISVLQTWLYNNTGRSILMAGILMHFFANMSIALMAGTFEQFSIPPTYYLISVVLYALTAAVVVIIYGPNKLVLNRLFKGESVEGNPQDLAGSLAAH